jgi:hypothetical protein
MRTILVLLNLAGAAEAQTKAVKVNIATPGEYVILVDAAGNIAINVLPTIAVGGGVVVPPVVIDPVVPPVPPVVPPVSDIAASIQAAVEAIPATAKRNETAAKVAGTYQLIAAQIKDGKIPQSSIPAVINGIKAFLTMGDGKWEAVIDKTLTYLATCASPTACADVFTQSATGILATIPEPQADAPQVELSDAMQAAGFSQELVAKGQLAGFDWAKWLPIILQLIMSIIAGI